MDEIIKKSKRDISWGYFNPEFLMLISLFLMAIFWFLCVPFFILYLIVLFSKWFLLLIFAYVYLTLMIFRAFKY